MKAKVLKAQGHVKTFKESIFIYNIGISTFVQKKTANKYNEKSNTDKGKRKG